MRVAFIFPACGVITGISMFFLRNGDVSLEIYWPSSAFIVDIFRDVIV